MSVLIQNKYGEYKPLENERVEASDDAQLVYATGFLKAVNDAIDDIKHRSYFIGFRLDEANRYKYYESLGYANIEELAEAEFGFGRSTTYGLMQAFNYAKSETPLYIADKFRGYSYTALLEMSKAKTIRGRGGIERILTPKDSVSKIKEVRRYWDKYISENGELPDCKTADEFLLLMKTPEPPAPAALTEHIEAPEPEENEVQSIGLTEPGEAEQTDEEFEAELEEVAADEELIQHSEPGKRAKSEIIKVGLTGVDIYVNDAKFKIVDRYRNKPLEGNFPDFIKGVYNYGNKPAFYHGFAASDMHRSYSEKGMEFICFEPYQNVKLTWEEVAQHISELIYTDEYLTEAEQEEYIQWKAEQDGLVVNVAATPEENKVQSTGQSEPEAGTLPISDEEYDKLIKNLDSLIKPKDKAKAKLLNLKNEKARKAWLDGFRSWGVWLEVPQVDKTFYRFDFANGAALIVEVGFEYWSFSSTPGAKERVAYSIIDDKHDKFDSKGICYTDVITWLTAHAKEV